MENERSAPEVVAKAGDEEFSDSERSLLKDVEMLSYPRNLASVPADVLDLL